MKLFIITLIALSSTAFASRTVRDNSALISGIVMVGASGTLSVSSPGDLLAEHILIPTDKIWKKAYPAESNIHDSFIRDDLPLLKANMLLGVDLFFHDANHLVEWPEHYKETKDRITDYISIFAKHSKYVVIGEVFSLTHQPSWEDAVHFVNNAIHTAASKHNVVVLPLYEIMYALLSGKEYLYEFENVKCRFKMDDLIDGTYHANYEGEIVLTNLVLKELRLKFPEFLSIKALEVNPEFFNKGICSKIN